MQRICNSKGATALIFSQICSAKSKKKRNVCYSKNSREAYSEMSKSMANNMNMLMTICHLYLKK